MYFVQQTELAQRDADRSSLVKQHADQLVELSSTRTQVCLGLERLYKTETLEHIALKVQWRKETFYFITRDINVWFHYTAVLLLVFFRKNEQSLFTIWLTFLNLFVVKFIVLLS